MKKKGSWKLPLIFLLGYMFAWGSILIDQQMVIRSQWELVKELERTKKQLQLREIMEGMEFIKEDIETWNEANIKPKPKEDGK